MLKVSDALVKMLAGQSQAWIMLERMLTGYNARALYKNARKFLIMLTGLTGQDNAHAL